MDENRLNRLESAIEVVRTTLHSIDKTLVIQAGQLRDHMKRTELNEQALETLKKAVHQDLAPIKRHVAGVNYLLKAVGVLAIICSAAFSCLKAYDYLVQRSHHGDKTHVSPQKGPSGRQ